MRRFSLTLVLFGTAVVAAFLAPRLFPAAPPVVEEVRTLPAVVEDVPEPVVSPIVTIPELDEPLPPSRPPVVVLPPDPPDLHVCAACGMG